MILQLSVQTGALKVLFMWEGRHHGHGCAPTVMLIYCTLTVGPLHVPPLWETCCVFCGSGGGGGELHLVTFRKIKLIKYYLFEVILQMRKHFIKKTYFLFNTKQRLNN